ncbi:MAG: transposase [Pontiellaceae bacterium]|nr:transposase [Pontiellaceae bacterium]MBN2786368.1 transposase [Pontiellaceae bacterium]
MLKRKMTKPDRSSVAGNNVTYRQFLKTSLSDHVPNHSSISRNRIDRLAGTDIIKKVFDEIVRRRTLIDGKTLCQRKYYEGSGAIPDGRMAQNIKKIACSRLDRLFSSISGLVERICADPGALQKPNIGLRPESSALFASFC